MASFTDSSDHIGTTDSPGFPFWVDTLGEFPGTNPPVINLASRFDEVA
jgi:hypothetical protein